MDNWIKFRVGQKLSLKDTDKWMQLLWLPAEIVFTVVRVIDCSITIELDVDKSWLVMTDNEARQHFDLSLMHVLATPENLMDAACWLSDIVGKNHSVDLANGAACAGFLEQFSKMLAKTRPNGQRSKPCLT